MRITLLLTQGLDSPSGLGRYWPVAKELRRLGHKVTIIALHPDYGALAHKRYARDGVDVWYVGQMHVGKSGNVKTYFGPGTLILVVLRATLGLLWGALLTSSDIYHIGKPHPMNGVAGLLASRLRRRPLYVDCDDIEAQSNRTSGAWQRQLLALFEKWLPRLASGVTVNTRYLEERVRETVRGVGNVVYVPNGIDRARFQSRDREATDQLRRQLDLGERGVVLYVGSMSLASHPVDLLIDAYALMGELRRRVTLVLVGGGEDFDVLRQRVRDVGLEDEVRFVGRVLPDDVPAYYQVADVLVDPVHDDEVARARSPLKVVEAWACGVPVVTSDVGDRGDTIDGGGHLVAPGDAAALAEGIRFLFDNPDVLLAMRSHIPRLCESYYWDVLVARWHCVYYLGTN